MNHLCLTEISAFDDFFDVGGHSLAATRIIGELNKLGLDVTVGDLYQTRTIGRLADLLNSDSRPT
jgi:aryl carrier-like protein